MKTKIFLIALGLVFFVSLEESNAQNLRSVVNESVDFLQDNGAFPRGYFGRKVSVSFSLMDAGRTFTTYGYGVHSTSFLAEPDSNYSNPAPSTGPIPSKRNIKKPYIGSNGLFIKSVGNCNGETYFRMMLYKSTSGVIAKIFTYTPSRISGNNGYTIKDYSLNNDLTIIPLGSRDYGNSIIGKNYIIQGSISSSGGYKLYLSMKITQFLDEIGG